MKTREQIQQELGISPDSWDAKEELVGDTPAEQLLKGFGVVKEPEVNKPGDEGSDASKAKLEALSAKLEDVLHEIDSRFALMVLRLEEVDNLGSRVQGIERKLDELDDVVASLLARDDERDTTEAEDTRKAGPDDEITEAASLCPNCGADVGWDKLPLRPAHWSEQPEGPLPFPLEGEPAPVRGKRCPACKELVKIEG